MYLFIIGDLDNMTISGLNPEYFQKPFYQISRLLPKFLDFQNFFQIPHALLGLVGCEEGP